MILLSIIANCCRFSVMSTWSGSWIQQVSLSCTVEAVSFSECRRFWHPSCAIRQALFATFCFCLWLVPPGHDTHPCARCAPCWLHPGGIIGFVCKMNWFRALPICLRVRLVGCGPVTNFRPVCAVGCARKLNYGDAMANHTVVEPDWMMILALVHSRLRALMRRV